VIAMKAYKILLLTALAASPASANLLGPTPYLCFDRTAISGCGTADSPFAGQAFSYFHIDNFEDGALNTPGVTQAGGVVGNFGGIADSVDEDDGIINGSGVNRFSMFSGSTITYTFSAAALGALPTHAGIVYTDTTAGGSNVTFRAFDANGTLLGERVAFLGADGSNGGETAEDRFFGWSGTVGVGSISITASTLEVDHLQYGLVNAIPEPASWAMMIAGFGFAGSLARMGRRRSGAPARAIA
jgi:hypothetical protein